MNKNPLCPHCHKDLMSPHFYTRRQWEVVDLVCQGKTNEEIGKDLGVSTNTVRFHLVRLFKKLNVTNRVQLILFENKRMRS